MKKTKKLKKFRLLAFVIGITSISVFGCFANTEKWQEEVALSDGRTIIVDRETLRERGGGEIVSSPSGTKPKEYRIRFAHPDGSGKIIEWRGAKKGPSTMPEFPLVLDIESGQPIVYTIVGIKQVSGMYSKYVYKNDVWQEEELPETFVQRTANLFLGVGIDMPKYVDLEKKKKENKSSGYSHARKQVGPNRQVVFN